MADRVRELTNRNRGRSMRQLVDDLRAYLRGWKNYFRLAQSRWILEKVDKWIRRRVRLAQLRQWRRAPKIYRELRARGATEREARGVAANAGRWWAMSHHIGLEKALPNHKLISAGILQLAV